MAPAHAGGSFILKYRTASSVYAAFFYSLRSPMGQTVRMPRARNGTEHYVRGFASIISRNRRKLKFAHEDVDQLLPVKNGLFLGNGEMARNAQKREQKAAKLKKIRTTPRFATFARQTLSPQNYRPRIYRPKSSPFFGLYHYCETHWDDIFAIE